MEILRKLKAEFDKLSKRNKSLVVIGIAAAVLILLEIMG
tara:strand:- start:314 stop:430 length:117 start_codon:yes stop_codon:yes gene_type:complete